jgi:hypothetical protein
LNPFLLSERDAGRSEALLVPGLLPLVGESEGGTHPLVGNDLGLFDAGVSRMDLVGERASVLAHRNASGSR